MRTNPCRSQYYQNFAHDKLSKDASLMQINVGFKEWLGFKGKEVPFGLTKSEKNFSRNALLHSFQVVIESLGRVFSHWCALSPKEKGNSLSLKASSETPLVLDKPQYLSNLSK
ncbi:hypothetical protein Bca4012_043372 [Brassica carinata]